MAGKVFISYRWKDSADFAGRVHDRLKHEFGRDLLFIDVDAIPLGADIVEVVGREIAKCDVLLAIIGPNWVEARARDGSRRLEDGNDLVRIEIATALSRGIPVIPVLTEGTTVPLADQLPGDLKGLVRRSGLEVRHSSFHSDMDTLIRGLKPQEAAPASAIVPRQPSATSVTDHMRGRIKVDARIIHGAPDGWFKPGLGKSETFKDLEIAPEMVVVPAGAFVLGSDDDDGEPYQVTMPFSLAVGRFAVTFDEWDAAVVAGGVSQQQDHRGWGRGRRPVLDISWDDAQDYCTWLSIATGQTYRLLTEEEWEYCFRTRMIDAFWWEEWTGRTTLDHPSDYNNVVYVRPTVPVHEFEFGPNLWGLYDAYVAEWTEDGQKRESDHGYAREELYPPSSFRVARVLVSD